MHLDFDRATMVTNNLGGLRSSSEPPIMRFGNLATLPDGTEIDLVVSNGTSIALTRTIYYHIAASLVLRALIPRPPSHAVPLPSP